jgi:predicted dehydrogenase
LVIGAGFGRQHVEWISDCPNTTVEFVGYRQAAERAARVAAEFGARPTADPHAVIAARKVDAVAVVCPPRYHEEYLLAGLAAGLPVISDKPLAADCGTAARLAEAANSGTTMVTFQWRANPALRALRDLCAAGELGELVHLDLDFRHDFLAGPTTDWPWRHRWATSGAGTLGDQGVHLFDLLRWLARGPWSVRAGHAAVVFPRRESVGGAVACETEDVAEVLLGRTGSGGPTARVFVSRVSAGHRVLRARAHGTSGSAEVVASPDDGGAILTRWTPGADPVSSVFPADPMNPYLEFLAGFRDTVADFSDGYSAQQLLEDALRAGCGNPAIFRSPGGASAGGMP